MCELELLGNTYLAYIRAACNRGDTYGQLLSEARLVLADDKLLISEEQSWNLHPFQYQSTLVFNWKVSKSLDKSRSYKILYLGWFKSFGV